MKELTKFEEVLLLTILRLKESAYGVKIRQYISQQLNKDYTYGNLYSALDQLTRKEYVSKKLGEALPERRGKRRIYYSLTPRGREALGAAQKLTEIIWKDIPELSLQDKG